jgi:hypothetical protein
MDDRSAGLTDVDAEADAEAGVEVDDEDAAVAGFAVEAASCDLESDLSR